MVLRWVGIGVLLFAAHSGEIGLPIIAGCRFHDCELWDAPGNHLDDPSAMNGGVIGRLN